MAEYNVTGPDGAKYRVTGPDGASDADVLSQVKAYKPSRGTSAAAPDLSVPDSPTSAIPGQIPAPPAPSRQTATGAIKGAGEVALTGATALAGGVAGGIGGLWRGLTGGKYGTPEGGREASARASEISSNLTYSPRTEEGQNYMASIGKLMDESKLAGLNPAQGMGLAGTTKPALAAGRSVASRGVERGVDLAKRAIPKPPAEAEMRGMGAANVGEETLRRERAAQLPVPISLTKGQAGRTFEQQRFERETAKDPKLGEPLRERFTDQNKKILLNFDSWLDQTGAEQTNVRGAGQSVVSAIEKKAKTAKGAINAAYDEARAKGELAQPVSTQGLVKYLEQNRPEAINAPVLQSVEQKLIQLGGATKDADGKLVPGQMALNDLEELRKMVNRVSGSTATNIRFGSEAKQAIDAATEGAGGSVYARARRLRTRYAREFEDQGVIDKLIRTKPGTTDRAVAFEDVFNHAIIGGSLDDTRALRRVLQTQGPQGQQAWKEMQGQTMMHLREAATKGISRDTAGNAIVSPAALDRAVAALEKDGKLDFVFGKKGAQQVREINQIAKDVYTAPPGTVNTSNTASVLMAALDSTISAATGLPAPIASALKMIKDKVGSRKTTKRVKEALNDPTQPGQIPSPP